MARGGRPDSPRPEPGGRGTWPNLACQCARAGCPDADRFSERSLDALAVDVFVLGRRGTTGPADLFAWGTFSLKCPRLESARHCSSATVSTWWVMGKASNARRRARPKAWSAEA